MGRLNEGALEIVFLVKGVLTARETQVQVGQPVESRVDPLERRDQPIDPLVRLAPLGIAVIAKEAGFCGHPDRVEMLPVELPDHRIARPRLHQSLQRIPPPVFHATRSRDINSSRHEARSKPPMTAHVKPRRTTISYGKPPLRSFHNGGFLGGLESGLREFY